VPGTRPVSGAGHQVAQDIGWPGSQGADTGIAIAVSPAALARAGAEPPRQAGDPTGRGRKTPASAGVPDVVLQFPGVGTFSRAAHGWPHTDARFMPQASVPR
jgi:hypothetical protein